LLVTMLLACSGSVSAADVRFDVSGISDPLLSNVLGHVSAFSMKRRSDISKKDYDDVVADAISKAKVALRPFGYYQPTVNGNIVASGEDDLVIRLKIIAGPPVLVDQVTINIVGEGANRSSLKAWRDSWPLTEGQVLDQQIWEERKLHALENLALVGYLAAEYTERRVELDLDTNRANLVLTLDTGKRFSFGQFDYGEHVLRPGIVEAIPRFKSGDPYSATLLDKFRLDLRKTGYFTEVIVEEIPRPDQESPVVDLNVRFETATRNTYQGSIGYGTDTSARLQAQWSRHPMSSYGDRLDIGVGWQEYNDEYSLRATYRIPRRNRGRQFWTSDLTLKHENLDFDIRFSPDEDLIPVARGTVDESHLRLGRLKVRNFKSGEQQALETLFVQTLNSSDEFAPVPVVPDPQNPLREPEGIELFGGTTKSLSIGFDYDLAAIYGKAWETDGHRDRAWIFASGEFFGSDRNFVQAYVSTRRNYLMGDRWKFLVRAEAGYTDAEVFEYQFGIDGGTAPLSVTRLPHFYRFRAGGSGSVRGYAFEELSNNNIGSNHILAASAEVEMKVLDNWSAALFVDIGNAFNDWSNPDLKTGIGVGLRWYSIAGPIRVDVAQAVDLTDKPWRIHFTIGTPLL
jgi:translocation and assembly module TamA